MNEQANGDQVGSGWRMFFWAACIFNFVVGALGMLSPEATVDARMIGLFIFCFGILYLLVAREPLRFAPALWAGLIGKMGVIGLLGPDAVNRPQDLVVLSALGVNAIFAVGFLIFLLSKAEAYTKDIIE